MAKILIIDDDIVSCDLIAERLERRGYLVDQIHSGLAAPKVLASNDYDLILLDYNMPYLDGAQVLTKIRNDYSIMQLPVIMLTSHSDSQLIVDCLDLGANDFVSKPIDFKVLDARIRTHIGVKTANEAIGDQRTKLVSSSKMAALGRMAGSLAHEIMNPLSVIKGNLEIIDLTNPGPEQIHRALKKIGLMTDRISAIVNAVYQYSNEGSYSEFKEESLKTIIEETLLLAESRLNSSSTRVTWEVPIDLTLECKKIALSQVILNLINNSLDEMAGLKERWIKIKAIKIDDSYIKLDVIDSGTGIPANIKDKIFEPFVSSKDVGKGTGLGLNIVKNIIVSHHGTITVNDSHANTCFTITLPLEQPADQAQQMHVLIVDDDEATCETLYSTFEIHGYRISIANNGEDAMHFIEQGDVDIAVIDYMMPGMNGLELNQKISELQSGRQPETILITGFTPSDLDQKEVKKCGGVMYKPFATEELITQVRKIQQAKVN